MRASGGAREVLESSEMRRTFGVTPCFYETPDGRVLFGEYTFYHWSGFVPFDPDEADVRLGRYFKIPFK